MTDDRRQRYLNSELGMRNVELNFVKNQLLTAKCETIDSMFSVSVQDVSPSGAIIYTKKKLTLGQEIALTIQLPNSDEVLRATGESVRVSSGGFGVEFKIMFND
jgi:Tfp pilus assembly protein PilZ